MGARARRTWPRDEAARVGRGRRPRDARILSSRVTPRRRDRVRRRPSFVLVDSFVPHLARCSVRASSADDRRQCVGLRDLVVACRLDLPLSSPATPSSRLAPDLRCAAFVLPCTPEFSHYPPPFHYRLDIPPPKKKRKKKKTPPRKKKKEEERPKKKKNQHRSAKRAAGGRFL